MGLIFLFRIIRLREKGFNFFRPKLYSFFLGFIFLLFYFFIVFSPFASPLPSACCFFSCSLSCSRTCFAEYTVLVLVLSLPFFSRLVFGSSILSVSFINYFFEKNLIQFFCGVSILSFLFLFLV